MKKSIIAEKSFEFSIKIVNLCREQNFKTMEFELFRQLLKSGTSTNIINNNELTEDSLELVKILSSMVKTSQEKLKL